ncbi:MAG: hypothetical protein JXA54_00515 [Candidatus Heimdallarchaeota archaeon]|nr:hypothetical protein [Candidatus Heimdallarchaeota archaeon]
MNKKNLLYCFTLTFIVVLSSLFFVGNQIENSNSIKSQPYNNKFLPIKTTTNFNTKEFIEDDAGTGGDAGDSFTFATNITQGNYNGTLTSMDSDYYSFLVNHGVIINVSMTPRNLSLDFDLAFYSPETEELARNPKGPGIKETIIFSTSSTGNFFISITTNAGHIGNYSFSLILTPQNDFNTGKDAGSNYNAATKINAGSSYGTFVDGSDMNDFYQISLERGQIIDIFMNSSNTTDINIFLWDIEGIEISSSTRLVGFNESIYYAINRAGDYRIQLVFIESITQDIIIYYNLTIKINTQNDGNSGTDAGNAAENAFFVMPLKNSKFNGLLVKYGDLSDFYYFTINKKFIIYIELDVIDNVNFNVKIYNSAKAVQYSSEQELPGANEYIHNKTLEVGTYYIEIEFIVTIDSPKEGRYILGISLYEDSNTNNHINWRDIFLQLITYGIFPLIIIVVIILIIYTFTDIRIPWLSNQLDKRFNKEGKADTIKSLKYALRVRDEQISAIREELIEKDGKRAKDLETVHRLEEDQKSKEKVLSKIREENTQLKMILDNIEAVSDDLANIIDSTIRRQLAKTGKQVSKAKISEITVLLWLSEERLFNYITSVSLLNERYILDRQKNYILTREYAREIVRQAYWKRVGAMHLKKIKQVKVTNIADDTNIDVDIVKSILRELVERKEIPAPIHMDRMSLLLSISDELIAELADAAQNTAIISLKEISKSYDTTIDSARVIFEKIAEDGYAKGEFINEDIFIVYDLFIKLITNEGSVKISKLLEEKNLQTATEEIKIIIEKLIQTGQIEGQFITEDIFICYNNLTDPLKNLIKTNIEDINKGDTRRVIFDTGSVVESILKERLIMDIHEADNASELTQFQDVIESKELGRILRAAEDTKITLPSNIELKSLNRYWAQKIKHTKPGELPYIPTIEEAKEFLFEANRALNRLLVAKIPTKWKKIIAQKLLEDKQ